MVQKSLFPIFLFLMCFQGLFAQEKFELKNGIYLNFEQFLNNTPSFFSDTIEEQKKHILYAQNGKYYKLKKDTIWGYSINGRPKINCCKFIHLDTLNDETVFYNCRKHK